MYRNKTAIVYTLAVLAAAVFLFGEARAGAELPDLELEWVNFTKDGITASIKNTGSATTEGERIEVLFEWLNCASARYCKRLGNVLTYILQTNLEPEERVYIGSEAGVEVSKWVEEKPFSISHIQVKVDPAGKISEANEENNLWKERPISPKTPGRTFAAQDAVPAEGGGGSIRILPSSELYVFKNIWKEIQIAFAFNRGKKLEKRLARADERLREIRQMAREGFYEEVPKSIRRIENDFEQAGRPALHARLYHQLVLEDVEMEAPVGAMLRIATERSSMLVNLARSIFATKDKEEMRNTVREVIERRSVGPFYPLRGLKLLGAIQEQIPGGEDRGLREFEKELLAELQRRLSLVPEEVRNETAEYIASIHSGERAAFALLERIQELDEELGQGGVASARRTLERAHNEIRKELRERIQAKTPAVPESAAAEEGTKSSAPSPAEEGEEAPDEEDKAEEQIVCTAEYDPVCGVDDITYSNACVAEHEERVGVAYKGECELPTSELYIKNVRILPEGIREGDYLEVRADVVNDGGTAQQLFQNRLRLDAYVNGIFNVVPNEIPLNLITTSSSMPIVWRNVWQTKEGVHRVEVCADSARKVEESDEENNCNILAFPVGPAPTSTPETTTSTATSTSSEF